MCDPISMGVVLAVAGGTQAYSQYKQGSAQNKYYQYMGEQAKAEGDAAYAAGLKQSELNQDQAKDQSKGLALKEADVYSSQKAAMAANGIDLSSVTAEDLASDTFRKSTLDSLNLRRNADLNSWSIMEEARQKKWQSRVQADQYSYAGKSAKKAGKMQAFTTLLSTATSVAGGFSGLGGTKAVSGQGGYGVNTPSGTRNMGTWSKLA